MRSKWLIIYLSFIVVSLGFLVQAEAAYLGPASPEDIAQGPISVEEAKQIIINWSGRQNLRIEYPPAEHEPAPPFELHPGRSFREGVIPSFYFPYSQCYVFKVTDPNPDRKYYGFISVDSWTGAITHIYLGEHRTPGGTVSQMLSPSRAKELAKQYLLSYFPNVPVEEFSCEVLSPETTPDGSSWTEYQDWIGVSFYKELTNSRGERVRINVQNFSVSIGSIDGHLYEIEGCYEPIEISLTPAFSIEEAVEAAISFFYGLGAQSVEVESVGDVWCLDRESPNGKQLLTLEVKLATTAPPNAPPEVADLVSSPFGFAMFTVSVDGNTGEVRAWDEAMGGGNIKKSPHLVLLFRGREKKLKHNLLLQKGAVYISFEDLKSLGFRIEQKGKSYIISYKGKKTIVDTNAVLSKGKVKYLNGSSLGKLEGARAEYKKEENKFHIWFVNERAFKQGEKLRKNELPPQSPKKKSSNFPILGGLISSPAIAYLIWKVLRIFS